MRQLAKRFDVALSFVVKLLKQYRTTGEIAPKPFNGGVTTLASAWEAPRSNRFD